MDRSTTPTPDDHGESAEVERETPHRDDGATPPDSTGTSEHGPESIGTSEPADSIESEHIDTSAPPDNNAPREDSAADSGSTTRRPLLRRLAVGGLVALLIVTTGAAISFAWKLKNRDDLARASDEALAAARTYAVALTSIDAAHTDQDFTAVRSGATGDFARMYDESAQKLKPLLVQAKSVSKGRVVGAGVQSASTDRVVVVLFVDAEITNVTFPTPRVDRNRITMTMEHVDGRWLAGAVDLT